MKIVTKRKAIKLIRSYIKELVESNTDEKYFSNDDAFNSVHDFVRAFDKSGVLKKKELDMVWREMQKAFCYER